MEHTIADGDSLSKSRTTARGVIIPSGGVFICIPLLTVGQKVLTPAWARQPNHEEGIHRRDAITLSCSSLPEKSKKVHLENDIRRFFIQRSFSIYSTTHECLSELNPLYSSALVLSRIAPWEGMRAWKSATYNGQTQHRGSWVCSTVNSSCAVLNIHHACLELASRA